MEVEQSSEPRFPQGELHRVLRLAASACGLPDSVLVTAHALLRFVPADAKQPVSPARVQDLAEERGCDPRTIRSHIRRLEAYGLIIDRCAGGGRRMIQRRRGRIVLLQGIDFAPMLAAAEALGRAALAAEVEHDERRRLSACVSELKRRLRDALGRWPNHRSAAQVADVLAACPARHRRLALRDLAALASRLELAARLLTEEDDHAGSRILLSDRAEDIVRPNTTERKEDPVCRATPASGAGDIRLEAAVNPICLDRVAATLPFDWRARVAQRGPLSWPSLVAAAYERAIEIGVTDALWTEVQAALGRRGAAALVLLADADSLMRGGTICSPAAWVRAMTRRAERGPLSMHGNFARLLRRRDGAEPVSARHAESFFPPRPMSLTCHLS